MAYNLISQGVTPENFGAGAPGGFAGMLDRFSKGFGVGMSRYQNLGDSMRSYQDRNIASGVGRERARNEMMDSAQTRAARTLTNRTAEIKAVQAFQRAQVCVDPNSAECRAYDAALDSQTRAEEAAGIATYTASDRATEDRWRTDETDRASGGNVQLSWADQYGDI